MNTRSKSATPSATKVPPPIRTDPRTPDDFDAERIALVRQQRWNPQTPALLGYHRTIEEGVRMLAGRHWDVWSELLGSYVDVTHYMTDSEKRWRQRPTVNLLEYWFMLTHARLTENPPAVTFQPATADRLDRMLAEALTPVFHTLWNETGMDETFVRAAAWLIAAGEVYVETAVDFTQGPIRQLTGPAVLSMQGADGQTIERPTAGPVPYDRSGNPLAKLTGDGSGYEVDEGAEPYADHEGCLAPRVRSPLEVRSEWGADVRWEDKAWIITRSYLTPEEVLELYGVEVRPDVDADGSAGFLQRLLFSSGYFGAVSNNLGSQLANTAAGTGSRYVAVDTMWEKPSAFSPETDESPGGRLLVVTGSTVLHDSPRPYRTKAAGPIRRAQFIQLPGRGGFGSTPLEQLTPIQKTYNRGWAQILEHRNLSTNPILVVDSNAGIADDFTNLPGSKIEADFSQLNGGKPAFYLEPPPLSADVWRVQSMLLDTMLRLGSIAGAEGAPQTNDPSGELVSQLRFNSDRPVSVAARSLAHLITGVAEDWVAILSTIWTDEKVLPYVGEDQVYKTVTLAPDLWDGAINVRPDLENARLEAPEAKEARAMAKFTAGMFGRPGTPEAAQGYARYARSAGLEAITGDVDSVDADMVRHLMSEIALGNPFDPSILEEWYDYGTWLKVLREHLASPEYLKYDAQIQQQFKLFYAYIQQAMQAQALTQMQRQAPVMAAAAATQGQIASVAQANGPQDLSASPDAPEDPSKQPAPGDTPSPGTKAA